MVNRPIYFKLSYLSVIIEHVGPAIAADDGGISFRAKVKGKTVACRLTKEALQMILRGDGESSVSNWSAFEA